MAQPALVAHAEDAHDIASEFLIFEDYLPAETAADLSALATELFGLKTALLDLHTQCRDPRNARAVDDIDDEEYVVTRSIDYTFKDIHRLFGGLARQGYRNKREAHRAVWKDIDDFFYDESSNELVTRLKYYKTFVEELTEIVVGHHWHPGFDDLYTRIERLLDVQEDGRLVDPLEQLAIGTPRPVRSWERRRPYGLDRNGQPNGRGPPRDSGQAHGRRPFFRRPSSPGLPEVYPLSPGASGSSPPSTVASSTITGSSATSSTMPRHWLVDVWSQQRSNTQFLTTGAESACFGEHARGASRTLKEDHAKLLALPFGQNSSLEVRIYLRDRDRRGRIWCRTDGRRGPVEAVQPIASLSIVRKESCLQLCKPDSQRRLQLWANLRFISYERLVLFHCSFLALKAQEESNRAGKLDDHILHGEIIAFEAKIIDDSYTHALQIFKDVDSSGVRLQASVLRGPLKRAPVWTAFIKYNMMAREWLQRPEDKKVLLADLSRFIFTDRYEPQMAPTGEHELHFQHEEDATRFAEAIEDLAEGHI